MDTPPSIRRQYASPPRESPEQRRRRLANRRAAKYRHFRSLASVADPAAELQRQQNTRRQRERRSQLDDEARDRLRAQNRRRQQLRRQSLSDRARAEIREKQRERQRERRQTLDDGAREELRERERLRIRRRRRQLKARRQQEHEEEEEVETVPPHAQLPQPPAAERERLPHLRLAPELPTLRQHQEQQRHRERQHRLPFGGGVQITLPPPPMERARTFVQLERIPSLPHLQQVTRPTTSLLHATPPPPLFTMPGSHAVTSTGAGLATSSGLPTVAGVVAARPPHPTPIMPSVSLSSKPLAALAMVPPQQQQQPRTPIVLPPAHRSLPPLPDFLNSREAFNPATAAGAGAANATRTSRPSSSASRALFPSITDLPASLAEAQDAESFYQR